MSIISLSCRADELKYMGDLNNDLYFNSIDLSMFRLEFSKSGSIEYSEFLDMNVDGKISIADLVRMKKYLVGEITHIKEKEEGFSWVLLDGEGEFAIVTGVGYMFSTTCFTKTICFPGRFVWETSAFIKTDKYINPEYPVPTLTVANATINGETVSLSPYDNVIVDTNWIWECGFSDDIFYVPTRSDFDCLFTLMLDTSPIPYREMKVEFDF